ncbi:MAG: DinB family protein [Planctomycetes bacterium]|nr:DinB family protein [Planctomycetota bacterium]
MQADPKDAEFIHGCVERSRAGPPAVRDALRGLSEDDARRKPGIGKLSIMEHLVHMLDMEREVFSVRLRRVLEEDNPRLAPVDQEHFVEEHRIADQAYGDVLDEWERLRLQNVQLVERTTEVEWCRPVRHPDVGEKATFADVVARWARHDGEHVRQIEILARNAHERGLPGHAGPTPT